jgi:transcription initiation factor TFIID subunit 4
MLLQSRIKATASKYGLEDSAPEVAAMISHATEERLKNLLEKLSVIAEHRLDVIKIDERYEISQDVKGQLRFLEELDKLERKRHDEQEREILIKAAKSRSKSEDPEQAKLKAKAKEMQRVALEEMRQREANLTALQAIGPRKKPKLDTPAGSQSTTAQASLGVQGASSNLSRPQIGMRPRLKRVNLRDLLFLMEQDKETQRSHFLYKNLLLK